MELIGSALIELARRDLSHLKFYNQADWLDGFVVRYAKAYPMYEDGYEKPLGLVKGLAGPIRQSLLHRQVWAISLQ